MVTHSTNKCLGFSISMLFVTLLFASSQSFAMNTGTNASIIDDTSSSSSSIASAILASSSSSAVSAAASAASSSLSSAPAVPTPQKHSISQCLLYKNKANTFANFSKNAGNRQVGATAAWLVFSRANKANRVESWRNAINIAGSRVAGNVLERCTEDAKNTKDAKNNESFQDAVVAATIFGVEEAVCATTVRKQAQLADWLISRALQLARLCTDDFHYIESLVTNGDQNNVDRAHLIGTAEALVLNMIFAHFTKDK